MDIEAFITLHLTEALFPTFLEVQNESFMHNVPKNSQTHFKVTVVSPAFRGLSLVARHQRIYVALQEKIGKPIHALAIHAYSPEEWEKTGQSPDSPNCLGGSKKSSS